MLLGQSYNPQQDDAVAMEPLPPPIFSNNYEAKQDVCLLGDKFKATAVDTQVGGL